MKENSWNRPPSILSCLKIFRLTTWVRIIPAWVPANLISLFRALLIIPIYFAYVYLPLWWVLLLYLLAWFTDIVDGPHARYRHQQSNLGKFLDPGADKVLIVGLLILIAPGRFSPYVIFTILSLEVIIIAVTLMIGPFSQYFFQTRRKLGANTFGKMKMLCQGLSLAVLLAATENPVCQTVAEGIMWCAALLAAISIVVYLTSPETANASS
jgi:CDP-diacylglycerol--glycerol-3-phosphate 3-phosphatidyltransferase